jgi:hypothetical protein
VRVILFLLPLLSLLGQADPAPAPPSQSPPCQASEHRQFDFWLGEWEVRTPDGKLAGINRIEREYGGCVLHERYESASTYRGESLNAYDPARKVWHQNWVDNGGLLLLIEGGLRDGRMVMEGETTGSDGQVTRHRITWTPGADGGLRQHWESGDGKGAWTTLFDGRYTKRSTGGAK